MDDTGKKLYHIFTFYISMVYTGFFSVQVLEGALRVWGLTFVRPSSTCTELLFI